MGKQESHESCHIKSHRSIASVKLLAGITCESSKDDKQHLRKRSHSNTKRFTNAVHNKCAVYTDFKNILN